MAKRATMTSASLDFAFFHFLWQFYQCNRGTIRTHYKELTRKFLDFNNPEKSPRLSCASRSSRLWRSTSSSKSSWETRRSSRYSRTGSRRRGASQIVRKAA